MDDRAPSSENERRAEELFLDYLARRREGREESLDALCAAHPELETELRELYENMLALEQLREQIEDDGGPRDGRLRQLLDDLRTPKGFAARFDLGRAIGAGGQGEVKEAWERALQRTVAVKALRGPDAGEALANESVLARFLSEAQITAQLDHPGIVAVHQLGLDEEGQPYFTMSRVRGRELAVIFERSRSGDPEWPLVRCVTLLQRVCDTMTFAHSRGVVHRDLKPANVMIGSYGEVFVMDWGLARVAVTEAKGEGTGRAVHTVRDDAAGRGDPLLATMADENLGTVFYLAPELAERGSAAVSPAVDVYAVGAMLYELLSGRPPAWTDGPGATHAEVLESIRAGPPERLERSAPGAPPELVSVCERAMARDPAERYDDFAALSADIRAFLEGRVVRAHGTGPFAELRKWVTRNRRFAAAAALALVVALVGSIAVAVVADRGRTRLDLEADLYRLPYLEERARELWPEVPERVPAYERWLASAETLAGRLDRHRSELASLRGEALTVTSAETDAFRARSPLRAQLVSTELQAEHLAQRLTSAEADEADELSARLADLRARQGELEAALAALRPWIFRSPDDQLRHDTLAETVARLEAFSDPEEGLMREVHGRLDWARTVHERTILSRAADWEQARRVSAASEGSYAPGFGLTAQLGLVPLGPDPHSGLLEFAFPRSGEVPERGADGQLSLDERTALVFVLVPAGEFLMGAQSTDPAGAGYDAMAHAAEAPPHALSLAPFFLSKHEMTQGQWRRLTGASPSFIAEDAEGGLQGLHPVEGVSWQRCSDVLARFELTLPTEAQWEFAARAGGAGPFFGSDDARTLVGRVNLADAAVVRAGVGWPQARGMEWLDDGFVRHAPVGRFEANAFGLHDALGNVWEWCLDEPGDYTAPYHPGTGLRVAEDDHNRVSRGGGYVNNAAFARTTIRDMGRSRAFDSSYHGLRPARLVQTSSRSSLSEE
jgi:serine/threonine protein kinase/formylglycine-generating enzyme required for sulfatase activity